MISLCLGFWALKSNFIGVRMRAPRLGTAGKRLMLWWSWVVKQTSRWVGPGMRRDSGHLMRPQHGLQVLPAAPRQRQLEGGASPGSQCFVVVHVAAARQQVRRLPAQRTRRPQQGSLQHGDPVGTPAAQPCAPGCRALFAAILGILQHSLTDWPGA